MLIKNSPPKASTTSRPQSRTAPLVEAVADHPFRAIADVVSLSAAAGRALIQDGSPSAKFFDGACYAGAIAHGLSGFYHGLVAADRRDKAAAVVAIGDLLSCAGHVSLQTGLHGVGAGMVVFGNLVSSIPTFAS